MIRIEEILDTAISRIKNGEEISAVLFDCPKEFREQLANQLNVFSIASSLPLKKAPAPLKRKLFLNYEVKPTVYVTFMSFMRTTYAVGLTAFFLIAGGSLYAAAENSLPGDKLFTLKKGIETTKIKLASNQETKAHLQLEFAQKRLEDAQKVIAKSDNSEAKNEALVELKEQTKVALNNIKEVAASPAVSSNTEFLEKAEKIASAQAKITESVDTTIAKESQKEITKTLEDIRKIVAVANDQASASLPSVSDIIATGTISAITKGSIVVDRNTFVVNADTVIEDKDGKILKFADLQINDSVKIDGKLEAEKNIAERITVTANAVAEIKIQKPAVKPAPQPTEETLEAKPKDTFGGFIIEPTSIFE